MSGTVENIPSLIVPTIGRTAMCTTTISRRRRKPNEIGGCITEIKYTFSDSEIVDDFRPVHLTAGAGGAPFCCVQPSEGIRETIDRDDATCPDCIEVDDSVVEK